MRGPDILIEILNKNEVAGKIVIDCKNVRYGVGGFSPDCAVCQKVVAQFYRKLCADQLFESADFAFL